MPEATVSAIKKFAGIIAKKTLSFVAQVRVRKDKAEHLIPILEGIENLKDIADVQGLLIDHLVLTGESRETAEGLVFGDIYRSWLLALFRSASAAPGVQVVDGQGKTSVDMKVFVEAVMRELQPSSRDAKAKQEVFQAEIKEINEELLGILTEWVDKERPPEVKARVATLMQKSQELMTNVAKTAKILEEQQKASAAAKAAKAAKKAAEEAAKKATPPPTSGAAAAEAAASAAGTK